MSELRVRVHKAQGILPEDDIPDLTIIVDKPVPEHTDEMRLQIDAEKIVAALFRCLPGGTIDRMLVDMMRRRASQLRVSLSARRGQ